MGSVILGSRSLINFPEMSKFGPGLVPINVRLGFYRTEGTEPFTSVPYAKRTHVVEV